MIEGALVYIYAIKPTRHFVGCGTLVEGGFVATCRHVWRNATEDTEDEESSDELIVEIEYPRSRREGTAETHMARLADACDDPSQKPDLCCCGRRKYQATQ